MALDAREDVKRSQLRQELESDISRARSRALTEYWLGQLLMGITLVTSALPAVLGIFEVLAPRQLGVLATAPAALAFVATIFRFPAKANWYWRLETGLVQMRDKLLFGKDSDQDVQAIAASRTAMKAKMREEWEREFTISWVAFGKTTQPNS